MRNNGYKKRLLYAFFFLFLINAYAQQDMRYSQYMLNKNVINPAFSAHQSETTSTALYKKRWLRLTQANSYQLAISSPISQNRMGVGGVIKRDDFNGLKRTSFLVSYSYKINALKGKLSLGMQAGMSQFNLNPDEFTVRHDDDPILNGDVNRTTPTISGGIFYQKQSFYIGLSMHHLTQNDISFVENDRLSRLKTHNYLLAAYKVVLGTNLHWIPSILIKHVNQGSEQIDINSHIRWRELMWGGISIRTSSELSFQGGIQWNKIRAGYAYDIGWNTLGKNNNGIHEILISYRLKKNPSIEKLKEKREVISPIIF